MNLDQMLAKVEQGSTLSSTELGELADIYHTFNKERLRLDKLSKLEASKEAKAKALLIQQLDTQKISAIGGKLLRVELNPVKYKPHVVDWSKFYSFIVQTNNFSLLQKRPGEAAVSELWDDDIEIPGVEKFPVLTLSEHRIK